MNEQSSLSQIPVVSTPVKVSRKLHWSRRASQAAFLVLLLLIPISGLFRIDPVAGAFVVLDRQIWFSDFFIVIGFWVAVASALVITYSSIGTAFCAWACPQNTVSEWANNATHKLLGKRANVELDGRPMQVAKTKNNPFNWLRLIVQLVLVSALLALIPMFYFYSPDVVWSFVTFRDDERLAASLHYIYFIFVLIIFLNITFIRHFFCRFMCIYKIWQHSFKTRQTLHVAYDTTRSDLCAKCNLCVTSCFVGLDPRQTEVYDACTNCGECVSACNNLQAKKGQPGLLSFEMGERAGADQTLFRNALSSLRGRVNFTLPFTILGLAMFAWGLYDYQPYHMTAYRADIDQGVSIQDYRVNIVNKLYREAEFSVEILGLEPTQYDLQRGSLMLAGASRTDVALHIKDGLPAGVHQVLVRVRSGDGWQASHRIQHFVERGKS